MEVKKEEGVMRMGTEKLWEGSELQKGGEGGEGEGGEIAKRGG